MKMKTITLVLIVFVSVSVIYCGGLTEENLVNRQEIGLENTTDIDIAYSWETVKFTKSDTDKFIIKEYMSRDNSDYYAEISNAGNKLSIKRGKRPLNFFFDTFNARIEIGVPVSFTGNVNINVTSGKISGETITAGTVNLKASSGAISFNTINGNVWAETSSGSIRSQTVNGNASIKTTSGSIVFDTITGNASAEASSGSITLGLVHGTVDAKASSGAIRCAVSRNAGNVSLSASSGSVTLNIPRDFAFNFSSQTRSGSLRTPFSDKLFSPVSDRNSVQGIIGGDNASGAANTRTVSLKTTSGSIRVNWID